MTRALQVESLEPKQLLAADVVLDSSTGIIAIKGTEKNDDVLVSQWGLKLEVVVDRTNRFTFALKQVNGINFAGGDGDDQFVNNSRIASVAYGNRGNDRLAGGLAADDLRGGPGDDRLVGNDGNDELHGDYGNDVLVGGRGDDALHGWYGDDTLIGEDGNDYLSGYEGNDCLFGGNGNDDLRGHEGDDLLVGDDGQDLLYGWTGNDRLFGGRDNDYLSGWSGNDLLLGGDGDDTLLGHAGRDLLFGGKGADSLDGGSAEDLLFAGETRYDADLTVLAKLHAIWQSSDSLKVRVNQLLDGESKDWALNRSTVKSEDKGDVVQNVEPDFDWVVTVTTPNGNQGKSRRS